MTTIASALATWLRAADGRLLDEQARLLDDLGLKLADAVAGDELHQETP